MKCEHCVMCSCEHNPQVVKAKSISRKGFEWLNDRWSFAYTLIRVRTQTKGHINFRRFYKEDTICLYNIHSHDLMSVYSLTTKFAMVQQNSHFKAYCQVQPCMYMTTRLYNMWNRLKRNAQKRECVIWIEQGAGTMTKPSW